MAKIELEQAEAAPQRQSLHVRSGRGFLMESTKQWIKGNQ